MRKSSLLTDVAGRIYQLLIFLYPPSFRQEFGREMFLIFRHSSRLEQERRGTAALLTLWITLFFDLVATALLARLKEMVGMTSSSFARIAGLAGILAGLYWLCYFTLSGRSML